MPLVYIPPIASIISRNCKLVCVFHFQFSFNRSSLVNECHFGFDHKFQFNQTILILSLLLLLLQKKNSNDNNYDDDLCTLNKLKMHAYKNCVRTRAPIRLFHILGMFDLHNKHEMNPYLSICTSFVSAKCSGAQNVFVCVVRERASLFIDLSRRESCLLMHFIYFGITLF